MADQPRRWTAELLERACRDALLERARIRFRKLNNSLAEAEWTSGHRAAQVQVDDHKIGRRAGTIHELLHLVLDDVLTDFDEGLQEVIILAFEDHLDEIIAKSKRRDAWWRKHIQAKVKR